MSSAAAAGSAAVAPIPIDPIYLLASFADPADGSRRYCCSRCSLPIHAFSSSSSSSTTPTSVTCPGCAWSQFVPVPSRSPPPPSAPPLPPPSPSLLSSTDSDYSSDSSISYMISEESSSDDDSTSADDNDDEDEDEDYDQPAPASKSFVASLPVKIFPPNSSPPLPSCAICMKDFEINPDTSETVIELPCKHFFHRDCIVEWFQRSNTCPLCRYELPVERAGEEDNAQGMNQGEAGHDAHLRDEDGDTLMF